MTYNLDGTVMAATRNQQNQAAIWDDSVLVDSWNEALEEYKKYHSIHAKGGSLRDFDREFRSESRPAWKQQHDDHAGGIVEEAEPRVQHGQAVLAGHDHPGDQRSTIGEHRVPQDLTDEGGDKNDPTSMPPQPPLIASGIDDHVKRMMMSWYYAGYYTGLYEGRQQSSQTSKNPS